MPQPTGRDLHVDALLSNISIAYMNDDDAYVADKVFPVITVNKQSDQVAKYSKDSWFRDEAQIRTKLTESAGGGFGLDSSATYFCKETAFHQDISDDDIANADEVFDLEDDATSFCTEKVKLRRERAFAADYFTTGVWTTDLQGQTDTPSTNEFKCWDEDSSYPINDVASAKIEMRVICGKVPNFMIVAERVHAELKNNSTILSRYQYVQKGLITIPMLIDAFEIENYLVAKAIYATSAKGQTTSLSYILNQYGVLLLYVEKRPSTRRPSAGYTFRWNRPTRNGVEGERLEATVRKFDLPLLGGRRVEVSYYEDQVQLATDCGIFLNNAISAGRTITS